MEGLSIAAIITSGISGLVAICTVVVVCVKARFKDQEAAKVEIKYNKSGDCTLTIIMRDDEELTTQYTSFKNNIKPTNTPSKTSSPNQSTTKDNSLIMEEEFKEGLDHEGDNKKLIVTSASNVFTQAFDTFKEVVIHGGNEGTVIKLTGHTHDDKNDHQN